MLDLHNLIQNNLAGERIGLPSFCTANEFVLKAILQHAVENNLPVLIEATCNQVNQEGGYTGMKPADFVKWVGNLAQTAGIAEGQLLLGGDHLGPNPWNKEPVDTAMSKAEEMVRAYVKAGFRKIHLDASMSCGGEPTPSFKEVANRAARLCRVAEENAPDPASLFYVIGTEVPVPGGETGNMDDLHVTTPEHLDETISTHKEAFELAGVDDAWERVVSVVTQPGVDFSHSSVYQFRPEQANNLVGAINHYKGITFEGHSTDYQPTASLAELVDRHVFFLKVGPELTFRFREAIFALASIEDRLCGEFRSDIVNVLDRVMNKSPEQWNRYYSGTAVEVSILRHFSLSDRIRYYWQDKEIINAVECLFNNLSKSDLPMGLVTQFFGNLEYGDIPEDPRKLCSNHIRRSVQRYYEACSLA